MLILVSTPMIVIATDVVKDMITSKKAYPIFASRKAIATSNHSDNVVIGHNLFTATQLLWLTYTIAIIISTDAI